jgi:hypothetical protein
VADDGSAARFAGVGRGDADGRIPLWLQEPLTVRRGPDTLVMAADPADLRPLHRLARVAVPGVGATLPGWRGPLVLAAPSTGARLDTALGADATSTAQLAGITSPVDGSVARGATTHVFVNPGVFDDLGPRAAQIVVTHEAAHVATGAAASRLPQWLLEGFADYVALRTAGIPERDSARQLLAQVDRRGVPGSLPRNAEFTGSSDGLGAAYEAAWLACDLLAREYGETRLVAFYRLADRVGDTARAFRDVLGTTEDDFTRSWRRHLLALASAG